MTPLSKNVLLVPIVGVLLLGFLPAAGRAVEGQSATGPSTTSVGSASTPAPTPPPTPPAQSSTSVTTSTSVSASGSTSSSTSAPGGTETVPTPPVEPQVRTQAPQTPRALAPTARRHGHAKGQRPATSGVAGASGGNAARSHVRAPSPSALTPPSPFALGSSPFTGVPSLFIANFNIPPFLLPIYQAAGNAYGIPWQVLAAINEVETDYGRDLSLSSAGAEGWMQFLPSSWAQYGVDASGNGYADPYNPADAIFAAARYLRAAGGRRHIRTAIFAYNHSQSYVESVMLRVQLLHAQPPQLLQSLTALAEARFPVHAASHFADGFPAVAGQPGRSLTATVVYSRPAAPVIAVQDGTIAAIGSSAALGRYVVLRDAYGDEYTYGHLSSVAAFYPVLSPRRPRAPRHAHGARARSASAASAVRHVPIPAASAGVQPRSPFTTAGVSAGLAFGAAAALEAVPAPTAPLTPAATRLRSHTRRHTPAVPHVFTYRHEEVHLRSLRVGAQVIAGTVLGHLEVAAASPAEGELIFQIRPAGVGAPLIDPKPILDAWVSLGNSLAFRAVGRNRFPAARAATSAPTAAPVADTHAGARGHEPPQPALAATAAAGEAELTPGQWLQLIARLGAIPDPLVKTEPSAAAIPDQQTGATADQQAGTTADRQMGATTEQQAGAMTEQQANTTTDQQTGTTTGQQANATTDQRANESGASAEGSGGVDN
jgi:hypothetical protein